MEPTTDANRLGWQLRGANALAVIVKLAMRESLPPLDWSVTLTGVLIGKVSGLGRTAAQMRSAYQVWTDALEMDHRPVYERDGSVALRGDNDSWGKYKVKVCVMADIYPDE